MIDDGGACFLEKVRLESHEGIQEISGEKKETSAARDAGFAVYSSFLPYTIKLAT